MTPPAVLVVGYGNPLRGDDGIGWHAAHHLATDPRLVGVGVGQGSLTLGDHLSTTLEQALPDLVEVVAQLVSGDVPAAGPRPTWRSAAAASPESSPR